MEMERTAAKQVWSNDCFSFNGDQSRSKMQIYSSPSILPLNGTTTRKIENSSSTSTERILLCGIILSLVILNLVIIFQDFSSSFHCMVSIFKSFLRIFSCIWIAWAAKARPKRPIETKLQRDQTEIKVDDDPNLGLLEVKGVIKGTLCNLESCGIQENPGADKITGLFEEEEPSLKEVKEAFDIFDENKDGFIDAKELGNVLFSLGFMEASEEDCRRMIKAFDDNLDGRIDLTEFTKVMERSFW